MQDRDKVDRLNQLLDDLFSPTEPKYSGREHPPFDITQVAWHKSKREFLDDLKVVKGAVKHLNAALELINDGDGETHPKKGRIQEAVDKAIRNGTRRRKLRGGSSRDLAIQNIRETGFFDGSCDVLRDMVFAYQAVLDQLLAQQEMFWSMPNRPPDHFARHIALRFARLFHEYTGNTPTLGTSSQGGHPSTKYSLALEEIYKILDIERDLRTPAEWALAQFEKELREQLEKDAKDYSRRSSMGAYRDDVVVPAAEGSTILPLTPQ